MAVQEGASVESQLAVDDQAVYVMVRGQKARNLYQMVKINKKSGEVELHDIAEYKNDEQTIYSSMPFSFKKAFSIMMSTCISLTASERYIKSMQRQEKQAPPSPFPETK